MPVRGAVLDTIEFRATISIVKRREPATPAPRRARAPAAVPIDKPAQLRALASPLRQELLDLLESAGPLSIAALGAQLGRAPDALYFHVRKLVRVGLVREHARERDGRHAFAVYDAIGRPLRIDRERAPRRELDAVVGGILRLAARDFRRASASGRAIAQGSARNHCGARVRGWLDAAQLAEVNALLERLGACVREGRPGPGRQPIALAYVLAPVPPTPRAARRAAATARRNTRHTAREREIPNSRLP